MKPKSKKRTAAIVAACALLIALLVAVLAAWRPWAPGGVPAPDSALEQGEPASVDTRLTEDGLAVDSPDPSLFPDDEERERYEATWHTDGSMRSKYGSKTVTDPDTGERYVAGELLARFAPGTDETRIEEVAAAAGGTVASVEEPSSDGTVLALVYFADDAALNEKESEILGADEVESAGRNGIMHVLESSTP